MRKTILLSALMLMATAAPSAAQTWSEGIYIRLFGGGSLLQDDTARMSGTGSGNVSFDPGFTGGAAIGYEVTRNISVELELAYRSANVSRFSNAALGTGGDYASVATTANILYQFDGWTLGAGQRLRPFVGAGLGLIEEIDFDVTGGTRAGGYSDTGSVAVQFRGGLNWELSRNWVVSTELRYFTAGSPKLAGPSGRTLEVGYDTIDLIFGLAYRF